MDKVKIYKRSQINYEQENLIQEHVSLVHRIAYQVLSRLPPSVLVNDLIQSGMIGLIEAAKNFDSTKGASFNTYAGIRIRGSMIDEIRKGDWVPRSVHRNSRLLAQTIDELERKLGRDAKDYEIAEHLSISVDEYHSMLSDINKGKIVGIEDLGTSVDSVQDVVENPSDDPYDLMVKERFKSALSTCISNLPEREALVLALYYDEGLNLREIGEVLDVSESRVSQIHSQAMVRLKSKMSVWDE